MSFAHPQLLWLLALPAALLLASAFARTRASINPHPKIPRALFHRSGLSLQASAPVSPRPLTAGLALALLVLALARPQGATIATPSVTQSRDVLVAVDVSRSMLADDVAPTRLGRAQLLVRNLADELRGERLGLLPFAGTAFLQSPLSADYEIFRTFLDELGPDMIPAGGSNFAALLRTADEAFGPADATEPGALSRPDRYLVVLSDGEAEDDSWRPLAEKLASRGVRVLALGLGTGAGAMVPDGQGGLTKDSRGAAVLSRLNPATLQDLARLTDGAYRDASAWVDLPALLKETVSLGHASRVSTDTAPRRRELFAWFLAPALVLLAFSLVREFPPVPRVSTKSLHHPSPGFVRVLPFLAALLCSSAFVERALAAPPAATPSDPLVDLVGKLAAAPELAAPDLARLAALTAERGEQSKQAAPGAASSASVPEGAIRDALAAVSSGQASDPRAADWPDLRKRLEALLAPPPKQPPQNQPKPDEQKPKPDQQEKPSPEQSSSGNPEKKPESENSKPDDSNSDSKTQDSPSGEGSPKPSDSKSSPSSSSPKPDDSKPLGDLAKPPDKPDDSSATPKPAPSDQPPSTDEPDQQAGGVSASGRPSDAAPGPDASKLDPALVVPQERLERVRDSDAPARLFQLLQESETPPEARERRGAGTKQTW